jgi:aspartyl-tRNA(Asn)/glutamyl-tRNA(Gln) amidotransferase subunit A
MGATDLAALYRSGKVSPVEATAAVLARLGEVNGALNAVVTLDEAGAAASARRSAERWGKGEPLSVLDGVPVTIKDNILVGGMRATWGCRLHAQFVPEADEAAVARLRAAGAVILGKTNVPEFTLQGYTDNPLFGPTFNPIAPGRTPGGSSGGAAAAVAAGIGPLALGTDGGGSIRRPAAHCGLFGFKPSIGQIARYGSFPQILSDFEVIGLLARTLGDVRAAFGVLRGHDPRDPRSLATLGEPPHRRPPWRIGFFPTIGDGDAPVDPLIAAEVAAFARSLEQRGCIVEPIAAPFDAEASAVAWGVMAVPASPGMCARCRIGSASPRPTPWLWRWPERRGARPIMPMHWRRSRNCASRWPRSSRRGTCCCAPARRRSPGRPASPFRVRSPGATRGHAGTPCSRAG